MIETFVHRLLAFSSIPIDLLIPPYSVPLPPVQTSSQPPRIGKIALHPELPIVALAHAHPGGFIYLFDLRTNAFIKYKLTLGNHHQVNSLSFSKYNLLAAGTSSGEIIMFDLNLSVSASTSPKPPRFSAIPSFAALVPPQFPSFQLLGEITGLSFDQKSARYLAISTTRSGTWILDTIYSTSLRLSKHPSSAVAFSPNENILAVAREKTGDIEFFTVIRAGTLTFSLPTIAKSGFVTTVTHIQWTSDGKSLLYCNDGQEGVRILRVEGPLITPPGGDPLNINANRLEARYLGNIPTPVRVTPGEKIPYGGIPMEFALDQSSRRLVVSYSRSPLLEVLAFPNTVSPADALSVGLIRGPSAGKIASEKAKGKRPEGQSPFEENSWVRTISVGVGFVGQAVAGKRSLLAGGWNDEDGGKLAFVPFYFEDINE